MATIEVTLPEPGQGAASDQVGNDPALAEWRGCKIVAKPARAHTIVSHVADLL
jgi:hypothetical protein